MSIRTRRSWAGFIAIIVIAIAAVFFWQTRNGDSAVDRGTAKVTAPPAKEAKAQLQLDAEEARRAGLVVKRLEPTQAADIVELFGTVEVNKEKLARVVPPVAGRIVEINANLGDAVKAGAPLALIASPETGQARADYAQAKSGLALAAANFNRIRSLVARGYAARKEEQAAVAEYEKARAALEASAAKLRALGVEPEAAGTGRLTLTAPFSGTIVEKTAVLGEYAQANQPLFTVGDLSSVWIQAEVYDRDLGRVSVGAPATVRVAAFPGKSFAGKLTYVSSTLDPETRTAKARIEVPNPERVLKPGMFASIAVATPAVQTALLVPETALVLLQGQMTAFVKDGKGFEPRPVETGDRRGDQITVKSGLEAGDEVVMAGAYALKARLLKSQIEAE